MSFKSISLEKYIQLHLETNLDANEKRLRKNLSEALQAFKDGVHCECGQDIWVIGSAFVGNRCHACITGESYPKDDYEIVDAIFKRLPEGEDIPFEMFQVGGYFDDDGNEIDLSKIEIPKLCLNCKNYDDPSQIVLCNLTRFDQAEDKEFICYAHKPKDE